MQNNQQFSRFTAIDSNADGVISEEEFEAHKKQQQQRNKNR